MNRLLLTRFFVAIISIISISTLFFVYSYPPKSMATTRDGIPHFTPNVINPVTGETIGINFLVKHFKGG